MDNQLKHDLAEGVAGALDWWRGAGVEYDFQDEPIRWIEAAEPETAKSGDRDIEQIDGASGNRSGPRTLTAPPAQAIPKIDVDATPNELSAFTAWWLTEPLLADGPASARVSPRGPQGAELMIVVPEAEREDTDFLLSGPEGTLLNAMLSALGIDQSAVYFASVLPRHMPGANWAECAEKGLGEVLCRHVSLVQPKRLAIFGANILPLIGHDPPQGPADLRIFNHDGASISLLVGRSLAALREQPRWKAKVWQGWLDLTA